MWWARWRANNTSRLQKLAPGGSSSTAEIYARDMAGDPLLHRWNALTAAQWSTARAMTPRSMITFSQWPLAGICNTLRSSHHHLSYIKLTHLDKSNYQLYCNPFIQSLSHNESPIEQEFNMFHSYAAFDVNRFTDRFVGSPLSRVGHPFRFWCEDVTMFHSAFD